MQDRFRVRGWNGERYRYDLQENEVPLSEYANGWMYNLEQCTGLKDKNGKLIYDNDLIKINDELYRVAIDDFGCRTVILNNNPFTEVIEWSDIVKQYYFYNREDEIEVVGNIHENADLLGEE